MSTHNDLLWKFDDGDVRLQLWGPDSDGDYKLEASGYVNIWMKGPELTNLAIAIFRDRLGL